MARRECFYDVLGIGKDAGPEEIKKKYRVQALQWHPDKNVGREEEARQRFLLIKEAYDTLSDPQEREWYDNHKEQILTGRDNADPGAEINLWQYFRKDCFDGFDDSPRGFYSVYGELFRLVKSEEKKHGSEQEFVAAPDFGTSKTTGRELNAFYNFWLNFSTSKPFYHVEEKYKADNRLEKRFVKSENQKQRKAARKEFNTNVRKLVAWVKKRDPRILLAQKKKAEQLRKAAEEKEQKEKEAAKQRQANREAARIAEQARWEQMEKERRSAVAAGQVFAADSAQEESDEEDETEQMFPCDVCRKFFKSVKQLESHEKSKKHKKALDEYLDKLQEEKEEEEAEQLDSDSEGELEDEKDEIHGQNEAEEKDSANGRNGAAEESSEDDADAESDVKSPMDSDSDEKKAQRSQQEVKCEESVKSQGSDDSDDDEDEDDESHKLLGRFARLNIGRKPGWAHDSAEEKDEDEEEKVKEKNEAEENKKEEEKEADAIDAVADASQPPDSAEAKFSDDDSSPKGRRGRRRKGGAKNVSKNQPEAKSQGEAVAKPAAVEVNEGDKRSKEQEVEKWRCRTCESNFPSRNKLFQHIKATGHAIFVEKGAGSAQKAGNRKKAGRR